MIPEPLKAVPVFLAILFFTACEESARGAKMAIFDAQERKVNYGALCDEIGDPMDPYRAVTRGIPEAEIPAGAAIPNCEKAISADSAVARYHYQLGRAYMALGRTQEAADAFTEAARLGYPPAYHPLGKMAIGSDTGQARRYLNFALSNGYSPSATALEELDWYIHVNFFDAAVFSTEMGCLYFGEWECLNHQPTRTYYYLTEIFRSVDEDFRYLDGDCFTSLSASTALYKIPLTSAANFAMLKLREIQSAGDGWGAGLEFLWNTALQEAIELQARKDVAALVNRYSCSSEVTQTLFKNSMRFISGNLENTAEEILEAHERGQNGAEPESPSDTIGLGQ